MNTPFAHEPLIRLGVFAGILAALVLWEYRAPWRLRHQTLAWRWTGNWSIFFIDVLAVRLLFPLGGVGIALYAEQNGFGFFNHVSASSWLTGILCFLTLDCLIYWQHRIFHKIPSLWRLHRMHHADTELDVSSGLRFHPIEILLSMAVKSAAILLLGIPALTIIIFEIVLNATSMFNHSNIKIPGRLEPWLRLFIVTPAQHVIHHSAERRETDANFGFNLPWWDWLFGTYIASPDKGYDGMTIGLTEFRDMTEQRVDRLITQPFRNAESPKS